MPCIVNSSLHDRTQPALTTFDTSVAETDREAVRELVKDPFILDFLAADPVKERDLSNATGSTHALTRYPTPVRPRPKNSQHPLGTLQCLPSPASEYRNRRRRSFLRSPGTVGKCFSPHAR